MAIRLALLLVVTTAMALVSQTSGSSGEDSKKTLQSTTAGQPSHKAKWGPWRTWTRCSRTCGTGISTRSRACIPAQRKQHNGSLPQRKSGRHSRRHLASFCVGVYKQHRTCNIHACPAGTKDFRQVQCSSYNAKPFRGRHYKWTAMEKGIGGKYVGRGTCALSCQAERFRFVARLASRVKDGTRCSPDDPSNICVSGKCKHVGCDGVLDSKIHFDKCGVCGGDNTSCHIISGIFTRRSLPYGYNKVATIPKGACNINVTEIMPNRNFLALRLSGGQQYVINGNWVVGSSKQYTAVGTTFRYYRPAPSQLHQKGQKEYIIGSGPTNDSIDIMLLKQQENHGIMYEYTIPMKPQSSATDKATLSQQERQWKPNWTKPEVKVKGPLSLRKASEPLPSQPLEARHRPADEAERPSAPAVFRPELRDRYNRYGSKFSNYLGAVPSASSGRPTSIGVQPAGSSNPAPASSSSYTQQRSAGIIDVSKAGATAPNKQVVAPAGISRTHYNKANGHRLRHRGQHHGRHRNRKLSGDVPLRIPLKQYPAYQAQTLGYPIQAQHQTQQQQQQQQLLHQQQGGFPSSSDPQGTYIYPPVVPPGGGMQRVVPVRPVPIPQSATNHRPGVNGQYRPLTKYPAYGNPYQHVIPASRYPSGTQLFPQGSQLVPPGQPLTSGQQHRYDMVYYPQGGGTHHQQQQPVGSKWALNDQIAQSLPVESRYLLQRQIGNQDPSSDFTWQISGFTECSKTCGGGTQTTIILCVKGASQAVVTDGNCDNALKPETQAIGCNERYCPPAWQPTAWSACSTSCGRGTQTRDAECRQTWATNDVRPVSARVCQDMPKPDTVRMCNEDKPCVRWKIGDWSKCSVECARGQRTREVICVNSENRAIAENKCPGTRPDSNELCDMGSCEKTWFYTDWSEQCSTTCGEGVYKRKLHCSADAARCATIRRPEETKVCHNKLPCGGQWFAGPWMKCSVTCGLGVTRRDIVCMKRLGGMMPVGDENCLAEEKPESERPCENPECAAQWYQTNWSKCSKTCNTGHQKREVKCLDAAQRTATLCAEEDKQDVWRTCNTMPCSAARKHAGSTESACKDTYGNCRLVVQARLCHYAYYTKACCLSCAGGSHVDGNDAVTPPHTDLPEKGKHDKTSRNRRRQT